MHSATFTSSRKPESPVEREARVRAEATTWVDAHLDQFEARRECDALMAEYGAVLRQLLGGTPNWQKYGSRLPALNELRKPTAGIHHQTSLETPEADQARAIIRSRLLTYFNAHLELQRQGDWMRD